MDTALASTFLGRTFHGDDRIALVLLHRPTGRLLQRLAFVSVVAGRRWQAWLRYLNAHEHDVYYSLNTYGARARHRTKADVQTIRHVFLDIDGDAGRTLNAIRSDPSIPVPHHIVRSSPDRCQILWRVEGFSVSTVEALQHALARKHGADRAATDAARVARLPGFRNCKYHPRPFVTVASARGLDPYTPADFPIPNKIPGSVDGAAIATARRRRDRTAVSRSERDWSWAKRQLAAGRPLVQVETTLMRLRFDKRNPSDYAARTIDAAWAELSLASGQRFESLVFILVARRSSRLNVQTYAEHIVARAAFRCASRRQLMAEHSNGGRHVNDQYDARC